MPHAAGRGCGDCFGIDSRVLYGCRYTRRVERFPARGFLGWPPLGLVSSSPFRHCSVPHSSYL